MYIKIGNKHSVRKDVVEKLKEKEFFEYCSKRKLGVDAKAIYMELQKGRKGAVKKETTKSIEKKK